MNWNSCCIRRSAVTVVLLSAGLARAADAPATLSFDGQDVARAKASLGAEGSPLAGNLKKLLRDAEKQLAAGPFSVMDKKSIPPSGDKHDYASMAPYFWPDPSKPDGLPYIRKDGEFNPERMQYDLEPMDRMGTAAQVLGLAYYFTGQAKYADRAAVLIRAWFLDPATRMNPNVRYGQFHPGSASEGVASGVLETMRLVRALDGAALIAGSGALNEADYAGLKHWVGQYVEYLQTSPQGHAELNSGNNHETWCSVQIATYLLYLDRRDEAKALIDAKYRHLIDSQIEADGQQPHEMARTGPLHYSRFNIVALMELARLGDRVGLDLWHYQNPKGGSLRTALDWLLPRYLDPKHDGIKDISNPKPEEIAPVLRWAAIKFDAPDYLKTMRSLDKYDLTSDRIALTGPLAQ
ncbi:MAG: Alginate lyase [Phycisphaerales bacterium]|nr:Alginate lyase [Phycisphaerales bacterium]